ncbi:hypothetical protein [Salinibacterium sp. GXW1014]|uniref:hypothetical protein n=1 Tax=Salinibacterium sp. GXW1014 TaxID=3377838 RepID=UPI00383B89EA
MSNAGSVTGFNALGPFYRMADVAARQGRLEADVRQDVENHLLLGITLADGVIALPSGQFDSQGRPLPGLAELFELYGTDDPTGMALLLLTPTPVFDGATGSQWLRDGRSASVREIIVRVRRALES